MRTLSRLSFGLLAVTGSAALAQADPSLIFELDRAGLEQLLLVEGYTIDEETSSGFAVTRADISRPMTVSLADCEASGACYFLQARGSWSIGDSGAAREKAKLYDLTVPIAFVAVIENGADATVLAGRDVWLRPGRTRASVVNELGFTAGIIAAMTESLEESDPALRALWEADAYAP